MSPKSGSIKSTITSAYGEYLCEIMQSELTKEQKNANADAVARFINILNEMLEPQLEQLAADRDQLFEIANRLTKLT